MQYNDALLFYTFAISRSAVVAVVTRALWLHVESVVRSHDDIAAGMVPMVRLGFPSPRSSNRVYKKFYSVKNKIVTEKNIFYTIDYYSLKYIMIFLTKLKADCSNNSCIRLIISAVLL